jgi:GNAT superfamily N-acetyltransferase
MEGTSVVLTILQASRDEHEAAVRDLFQEYLHWVCPAIQHEFGVSFDADAVLEHDLADLHVFLPSTGRLLLAYDDAAVAGCACVRTIGSQIAEIKRMYVRPAHRRRGIGQALVEAAIQEMRAAGYSTLRLDSARFMTDAHALYRSAGFREIAPYSESEVPEEFRVHWIFMERSLPDGSFLTPGGRSE